MFYIDLHGAHETGIERSRRSSVQAQVHLARWTREMSSVRFRCGSASRRQVLYWQFHSEDDHCRWESDVSLQVGWRHRKRQSRHLQHQVQSAICIQMRTFLKARAARQFGEARQAVGWFAWRMICLNQALSRTQNLKHQMDPQSGKKMEHI